MTNNVLVGVKDIGQRLFGGYAELLRIPHTARFSVGSVIACMPFPMVGMTITISVQHYYGNYSLAGALTAVQAIALAVASPVLGKLVDKFGQRQVSIPTIIVWMVAAIALVSCITARVPSWILFCIVPFMAAIPPWGAMSRQRWTTLLKGDAEKTNRALSLSGVFDECMWVIGNPLASTLAVISGLLAFSFTGMCVVIGALMFLTELTTEPKSQTQLAREAGMTRKEYREREAARSKALQAEGAVEYKAMLYIPSHAPYDFHSREYQKGLQLYSSGVLIMDKCADLLPEHFRFVKGVVDSQDFSLNISREMLQHTRQLKVIAGNLEKKIKAELLRLQKDDREKYETFWKAFGTQIKVGVVSGYGAHKELLKDLLLFFSSKEGRLTSLAEYRARMPEEQKYIYYACGEDAGQLAKLPQAERIRDKGYEILYLTDEPDQFVIDALGAVDEVAFKSVDDADALPETDEEKAALEQKAEESKPVLDFLKETLGGAIKEARVSKILKSGAVCLTADGPITLEMEKYFQRVDPENAKSMKAQRVLELNPDSAAFAALSRAVESDRDKAARYAKLLYAQAQLIAGLPLEDPAGYTELVCSLMN